nr:putative integron gene cassette protein [uncultured bacterium]
MDILSVVSFVIGVVSFVASIVFFVLGTKSERRNQDMLNGYQGGYSTLARQKLWHLALKLLDSHPENRRQENFNGRRKGQASAHWTARRAHQVTSTE